jgi:stringent starvation protein B
VAAARGARYNPRVSPKEPLPVKKDVGRALLLKGSVFVHLDPRIEGVVVPEWLQDQPQLVLQIGLDMPVPIPDLRVDAHGVFGTLSFKGQPYACTVPWDAVFALVGDDGRGMVWPESMPAEIASEVEREVKRKGLDPSKGKPSADAAAHLPQPAPSRAQLPTLALAERDDLPEPRKLRKPLQVVRDDDGPDDEPDARGAHAVSTASKKKKRTAKKALPPYIRVVK